MIVRRPTPARRGGATVVEAALLMGIFMLFLIGIFEYLRYLFVLQVGTNAARDGARHAVVNVNNPDYTGTLISNDPTYPGTGTRKVFEVDGLTAFTQGKMGGAERQLSPRAGTDGQPVPIFQVFPCDSTTLYTDPLTILPKEQASNPTWNNARFTERVAVRIVGSYTALGPNMLYMGTLNTIDIIVVMGSEG